MEDMSEGGKGGKEDSIDTRNGKEITQSNTNFVSTQGRLIRNKKARVRGHMGSDAEVHDPRGRKELRREGNEGEKRRGDTFVSQGAGGDNGGVKKVS